MKGEAILVCGDSKFRIKTPILKRDTRLKIFIDDEEIISDSLDLSRLLCMRFFVDSIEEIRIKLKPKNERPFIKKIVKWNDIK